MEYSNWNLKELYKSQNQANNKILELNNKFIVISNKRDADDTLIYEIFIPELNKLALYFTLLKNNNKYNDYDKPISQIYELYRNVMNLINRQNYINVQDNTSIEDVLMEDRKRIVEKYVFCLEKDFGSRDILGIYSVLRKGNRIERKNKFDFIKNRLDANKYEYYSLILMFINNRKIGNIINDYNCNNIFLMDNEYYEIYLVLKNHKEEIIKLYMSILERKKEFLRLDTLEMYDIQYEFLETSHIIEYENARNIIKTSLSVLGAEYKNMICEAFKNNWINTVDNEKKEEGSFCYYVKGFHPYVTIKYNGSLENVIELAHELGHAMKYFYGKGDEKKVFKEVPAIINENICLKHFQTIMDNEYGLSLYLRENICKQIIDMLYEMEFYEELYNIEFNKVSIDVVQYISKKLDEKYYGKVVRGIDKDSWLMRNLLYKNYEDSIMYALAYIYAVCIGADIKDINELYCLYLKDQISLNELVGEDNDCALSERVIQKFFNEMQIENL